MRRVKTSAEEGDALASDGVGLYLSIVPCSKRAPSVVSCSLDFMRYLIAILALAGAVVSALALQVHYSTATEPCDINAKWDCGIVNHSPFAVIMHVPGGARGIHGYLASRVPTPSG